MSCMYDGDVWCEDCPQKWWCKEKWGEKWGEE